MLRSLPSIDTFFARQNVAVVEEDDDRLQDHTNTVSSEPRISPSSSPPPLPPPEEPSSSNVTSNSLHSEPNDSCSQPQHKTTWMYTETDPALWGDMTEEARAVLIDRGPAAFQNRRRNYPASVRDVGLGGKTRSLTNDLLTCTLHNGEKVAREWLIYSPSTGNVFCFPCMLFSSKTHQLVTGFSDWKHSERLFDHEKSCQHSACMLTLYQRSVIGGRGCINAKLVEQLESEKRYWREVLKRDYCDQVPL